MVRKHRAPKGALRQMPAFILIVDLDEVRKHRAPKGALRPGKTTRPLAQELRRVRKHLAREGPVRPLAASPGPNSSDPSSESTERQKVH